MCNRKNLKKLALNISVTNHQTPKNNQISLSKDGDTKENNRHNTNNVYGQGPACILPNLYLGAHYNADNKEQLEQYGINCIMNVASEIVNTEPLEHIQYHHIQWTHIQNNLACSEFEKAIKIILSAHEQKQIVLIHCQQGIERSAALVLAFLLYTTRTWTLDRALVFVKEKAPAIRPNMELLYQLREYEQSLRKPVKHNIQTRTRRSESIACSTPTINKHKLPHLQRPRSQSTSISTFNHKPPIMDKHVLAMASLLVLLSAVKIHNYNRPNTTRNNHLNTRFLKPLYI